MIFEKAKRAVQLAAFPAGLLLIVLGGSGLQGSPIGPRLILGMGFWLLGLSAGLTVERSLYAP